MNTVTRAVGKTLALAVPVVTETTHVIDIDQRHRGPRRVRPGQLLGWTALLTVCRDVGRIEAGRWGRRLTLAGVGAQLAFALLYLVTAVTSGEPSGAVWPVFLLGFVCLTAGGLRRRERSGRPERRSPRRRPGRSRRARRDRDGRGSRPLPRPGSHRRSSPGWPWVAASTPRTAAPEQPRPAAAVPGDPGAPCPDARPRGE